MILHELTGTENHQLYQELQLTNTYRKYSFLRSMVDCSLRAERPFLSQTLIKAINYHAIACLHPSAGEYRQWQVGVNGYDPPEFWRVPALMDDFVNLVNRFWEGTDPITLSAFVLWRLNYIHPFINGNGRTARAACFFVLCVKVDTWINQPVILPELLQQNRESYVLALQHADQAFAKGEDYGNAVAQLSTLIADVMSSPEAGTQRKDSDDREA